MLQMQAWSSTTKSLTWKSILQVILYFSMQKENQKSQSYNIVNNSQGFTSFTLRRLRISDRFFEDVYWLRKEIEN